MKFSVYTGFEIFFCHKKDLFSLCSNFHCSCGNVFFISLFCTPWVQLNRLFYKYLDILGAWSCILFSIFFTEYLAPYQKQSSPVNQQFSKLPIDVRESFFSTPATARTSCTFGRSDSKSVYFLIQNQKKRYLKGVQS